jgi:endonuclease/exonuclease/phosphatase family metal-dependent hydrolase
LFSRFRINDVTLVKGLKNSGVIVNVKTKSRDISIAGVHLASNTEDVRLAEINKIVFHQKNTKHKIILGDLNSISKENQVAKTNPLNLPEEPVRHEVTSYLRKAGYIDAALKTGKQFIPTVPLTKDHNITYYNLRLDYIFLSKELSKNLIDYRVIRDKTVFSISDHLPIITNIR